MNIVNRTEFNDEMFEELANFAQHQIVTSPYKHTVRLVKVELDKETDLVYLEGVRIVFNKPDEVQLKARVAGTVEPNSKVIIDKKDTIKIVIEAKAPSKEPTTVINVTKWFEPLEGLVKDISDKIEVVSATPNRWIFVKGTR